jgi:hypothetical protein
MNPTVKTGGGGHPIDCGTSAGKQRPQGQYLLRMATALDQLGDARYADFVDLPLHDSRPFVRMDTARFIASTGDVSNVTRLLPLLDDRTEWNGRAVASVALGRSKAIEMWHWRRCFGWPLSSLFFASLLAS